MSVWQKGPLSSWRKDCHFCHPSSQFTPPSWGVISEHISLFWVGCRPYVTNCPQWEWDVPELSWKLVLYLCPSMGVWGLKTTKCWQELCSIHKVMSRKPRSTRVWRKLCCQVSTPVSGTAPSLISTAESIGSCCHVMQCYLSKKENRLRNVIICWALFAARLKYWQCSISKSHILSDTAIYV